MSHDAADAMFDDRWAAARPGERVVDDNGLSGTATNDYMTYRGDLFRRFGWCSDPIAQDSWSPKGEWFCIRAHWKQFKRNAAA